MREKPTVLFVDDEPHVLIGLRRILATRCGHWDFRFLSDPRRALELVLGGEVDVVVTDIRMPDMDGFALLRAIRSNEATQDMPVTFLTGCLEDDVKRRALDQGATDLLNKPIVPEELVARIASMLRLHHYQNQLKGVNLSLEEKVRARTEELDRARLDIIWRLAKAGEYKDEETGGHVVRVGCYCRLLAEQIGMNRTFAEAIFLTSPLHDIGKIGVSDAILLKPDKLTAEEHKAMEAHCEIGARILTEEAWGMKPFLQWRDQTKGLGDMGSQHLFLSMAGDIARAHHERWNGSGYPNQLQGDQIPLAARMVALADMFDALGSDRPYRQGYPHEKVMDIIRCEAQADAFDPMVYTAFQAISERMRQVREDIADDAAHPGGNGASFR
ncbi:MAG: response regulator [Phycisphaerae bacterium]|nr:response regulator [Phycisphaerae bacterium]